MKRIKLYKEIERICSQQYFNKRTAYKAIIKFIQNNYRRRKIYKVCRRK